MALGRVPLDFHDHGICIKPGANSFLVGGCKSFSQNMRKIGENLPQRSGVKIKKNSWVKPSPCFWIKYDMKNRS